MMRGIASSLPMSAASFGPCSLTSRRKQKLRAKSKCTMESEITLHTPKVGLEAFSDCSIKQAYVRCLICHPEEPKYICYGTYVYTHACVRKYVRIDSFEVLLLARTCSKACHYTWMTTCCWQPKQEEGLVTY